MLNNDSYSPLVYCLNCLRMKKIFKKNPYWLWHIKQHIQKVKFREFYQALKSYHHQPDKTILMITIKQGQWLRGYNLSTGCFIPRVKSKGYIICYLGIILISHCLMLCQSCDKRSQKYKDGKNRLRQANVMGELKKKQP